MTAPSSPAEDARGPTVPAWRNVEIWPILHGVMEAAIWVREQLLHAPPDAVAVELPETLKRPVLRAVDRLPYLSMVHYVNQQGDPVYLPVEPTDAMMEALRFATEHGLPTYLVDRDTESYPLVRQPLPDPYAITRIGYDEYVAQCLDALAKGPDPAGDAAAEDALREATMAYHLQEVAERHERVVFVCGLSHARRVRSLLESTQVRPIGRVRRDGVLAYALDPEAAREVTGETPYLMEAYETWRCSNRPDHPPDRCAAQLDLLFRARERHRRASGEEVSAGALAVLRRFSRNYALVEGRLAPDFFQLLVASRGAVDDNFAYEVWDEGTSYAHTEDPPGLPTIRPTIEELYKYSRTMRFHRTIKQRRRRLRLMVQQRQREKFPGEWEEKWNPGFICSHQPEDLVVESYGAFLMKKARKILSEESTRVEPFSTSILDGIDIRETVRNWHEGRIYVRENRPVQGRVGAVVLIFDPDTGPEERYPWTITWQGEHDQESDMALYATSMGENLVGPGITRCEYGGMLLAYPPGRMFHVWEDPFFNRAETKPERLLLAAIDYCEERYIAYVADKPPRDFYKAVAGRFGKKILYVPIGQLSPITLKKIRSFHVLEGHHVRSYARDYIF